MVKKTSHSYRVVTVSLTQIFEGYFLANFSHSFQYLASVISTHCFKCFLTKNF